MIESSTFWLRIAACLYAVGLLHSILTAMRHTRTAFPLAMGAFRLAVVLHGVSLIDLTIGSGRVPVGDVFDTLSFCAFLMAVAYLILEKRYRFGGAAVAVFPLVFAMTLAAAMGHPVSAPSDARLRDVWLVVHIVLVLAGYAALVFTALAAFAYLIQERRLKSKQSSTLLERLPPLATLDNMLSKSLDLGFAFLTLGLVFGIIWAFIYLEGDWIANPNITLSIITWALLLIMMFLRSSAGWRGRKAAVMSLAMLGCSALTWVTHAGLGSALIP